MKVFLVLAHPEPKSFNGARFGEAYQLFTKQGHSVRISDLYSMRFDPDILKGWADRTFAMGRTYGNGRFYESGVFKGKRALLSVTTGGASSHYEKGGWNGDIHSILRPIQRGIFQFTGFSILSPHIVYGPAHHDQAERVKELERYAARLQQIEQEERYDVGSY